MKFLVLKDFSWGNQSLHSGEIIEAEDHFGDAIVKVWPEYHPEKCETVHSRAIQARIKLGMLQKY